MGNTKRKAVIFCGIVIFAVILLTVGGYMMYEKKTYVYGRIPDTLYNPYMGFAVNADYPDAVQDNTLVYIDITWREWEPEEGQFAIEAVREDNFWDRWQAEGKKAVLRFACDMPSDQEHMDIPDWLYEKTKDGAFYDHDYGKGYGPEYNNEVFREAHRKAILALGEAFGKDDMVAYVELGSLGHWGEWHTLYTEGVPRMPQQQVREEYIQPYMEAFPEAKLLSRRPFPETVQNGFGLYNDMTGEPHETERWLEWISQGGTFDHPLQEEQLISCPEVWDSAPIGGEFTSSLTYDEMFAEKLDRTLSLIEESHMTFIGPKCPVLEEITQYRDGVEAVLKNIGYRYGISKCETVGWKWSKTGKMILTVKNYGTAPLYFPWKMYLYSYDEEGQRTGRIEIPVDLTKLQGKETVTAEVAQVPRGKNYRYAVAIEDPDTKEPGIQLDMDAEQDDKIYFLN